MSQPLFLALLTKWTFDPAIVLGILALSGAYVGYKHYSHNHAGPAAANTSGETLCWFTAMAVLLVALESPVDYLADRYLFSVHMLQHLLLMLVVAPLIVSSVPAPLRRRVGRIVPGVVGRPSASQSSLLPYSSC